MTLRVRERMSSELVGASPDEPARRVLELFEERDVRHVLVFSGERLVGIVSDRDLIRITLRNAGRVLDVDGCRVADIMTPAPLEVARPEEPLREAARRMQEARVDALPVVEEDRAVGIVTSADVLAAYAATEDAS
ncbi:MAG: CBS domain-containing protein [Planctomycetota bacterium]|nr:MAG: CBS domain-containing protein [Planctomycetota bacterium]